MNKTDRERREINKKALLAGLKSRKGSLEKILFETMIFLKQIHRRNWSPKRRFYSKALRKQRKE